MVHLLESRGGKMEYIELCSAPTDEKCAQVGDVDYATKAKDECRRFIKLLRDKLGVEPDGASLVIKANQHDFGTYYEVACKFDMNNKDAVDYAFMLENNLPSRWS